MPEQSPVHSWDLPSRRARARSVLPRWAFQGSVALWFFLTVVFGPLPPRRDALPRPGSAAYEAYAEDFFTGLAALEDSRWGVAEEKLTKAVAAIPEEPAGWANRALLRLHANDSQGAEADLDRARKLEPSDASILALGAHLADRQGRSDEAMNLWRGVLRLNAADDVTRYELIQALRQQGDPGAEAEARLHEDELLDRRPGNLFVLADRMRAAAGREDRRTLRDVLDRLRPLVNDGPPLVREAHADLERELSAGREVNVHVIHLSHLLMGEREYERDAAPFVFRGGREGRPLSAFLRLAPPRSVPASPDLALTFTSKPVLSREAGVLGAEWIRAFPVWLNSKDGPVVFAANAEEVRRVDGPGTVLPFPGGPQEVPPNSDGVLALDWGTERTDFVLAGAGGVRFFQQHEDGTFGDATAQTGLGAALLNEDYHAVYASDVDGDGELELILAGRTGASLLLRKNPDGTLTAQPTFPGVDGLRALAWVGPDANHNPQAIVLDRHAVLHRFTIDRRGNAIRRPSPTGSDPVLAFTAPDGDTDELIVLKSDGVLVHYSNSGARGWRRDEIDRTGPLPGNPRPGEVRLVEADLDNNGGADLVLLTPLGGRVWLRDTRGRWRRSPAGVPPGMQAVVDLDGDGRLDLLGCASEGVVTWARNAGEKPYPWLAVRARGNPKLQPFPGQRVNASALGGRITLRTGTFFRGKPILGPETHFGLGGRERAGVLRVDWPNNTADVLVDVPGGQVLDVQQQQRGW